MTFIEMTVRQPQSIPSVQDSHPLGLNSCISHGQSSTSAKLLLSLTSEQHLVCMGIPAQLLCEVLELSPAMLV